MEPRKFKKGIYETDYGNSAYVSGPRARTAWDLDARERIPIELVDAEKRQRDADDGDEPDEEEER